MTIQTTEFEKIYTTHYSSLLRTAYGILRDTCRANDVVQESMLKLYKQKDYAKIKDRVVPWLFLVCKNTALKILRKDSKIVYQEEPDTNVASESHSPLECLSHDEEKVDNLDLLAKALHSLPSRSVEILRLRYFENMQYNEIAEELNISEGNVGFIICVAMRKLRGKCGAKSKKIVNKK